MNSDLDIISPTLFQAADLHNLREARFTLFDILPLFNTKREHKHLVDMVVTEWETTPDRMPESVTIQRIRNNAVFEVQSYSLTHTQVLRLLSRVTGTLGVIVRDKIERYVDALEARVLEQQAELVRKDAIIAVLKYEFGESSLASAFVFGMQQEAQDRAFQFIDKPKLLLANLTGPMTACFNNGVDFYSEHKHKRRTGESVWDFYTRIKTEQALALL